MERKNPELQEGSLVTFRQDSDLQRPSIGGPLPYGTALVWHILEGCHEKAGQSILYLAVPSTTSHLTEQAEGEVAEMEVCVQKLCESMLQT